MLAEGGYNDRAADPGGPTNFGISLRFLKGLNADKNLDGWIDGDLDQDGDIDIDDVRKLTPAQAETMYFEQFWGRYGYDRIGNQLIADKVFSFSVNMGPGRAHRIAQAAASYGAEIKVDGILGVKSIEIINKSPPAQILVEIKHEAAKFYRSLVIERPALKEFLKGWLARAYSE